MIKPRKGDTYWLSQRTFSTRVSCFLKPLVSSSSALRFSLFRLVLLSCTRTALPPDKSWNAPARVNEAGLERRWRHREEPRREASIKSNIGDNADVMEIVWILLNKSTHELKQMTRKIVLIDWIQIAKYYYVYLFIRTYKLKSCYILQKGN